MTMGFKKPREQDTYKTYLEWLTLHGWLAWRNNAGMAAVGEDNAPETGIPLPPGDAVPVEMAMQLLRGGRKPRYIKLSPPGSGDLFALKDGVFMSIEVKMPGKYPNAAQREWMEKVKLRGGVAGVIRNLADLEVLVESIRA